MKLPFQRKQKKLASNNNPRYRVITVEEPSSTTSEAYRHIKVGLEYSEADTVLKVIQICSSTQGEGKSTTLLNIAATYAEEGKNVIVIDLDLRRPKLHRAFKVENKNGIVDVLAGKLKLKDAIKTSDELGFDCLNRGSKTPYPNALLASQALAKIFDTLREKYDIILVDCPPALSVSDCSVIAPLTDGCLFVVNRRVTDKAAARQAIKLMKQNGIRILGAVFAGINKNEGYNSYYKYYYTSYYGDAPKKVGETPNNNRPVINNSNIESKTFVRDASGKFASNKNKEVKEEK